MIRKIWFDITNTPHVHFLLSIQKMLSDEYKDFIFSARDFSETTKLLEKHIPKDDFVIINTNYGKSPISKATSIFSRFNQIKNLKLKYDLSMSCGSDAAIWYSRLSGKKSIAFGDNDTAKQWTYARFVNFSFFPDAIPAEVLLKQGLKNKLYQYHGFKEDIYISYFEPEKGFLDKIPFNNYIVVRPENIYANYLQNSYVTSIVPELLKKLSAKGYNIVFLPRYKEDIQYTKEIKNIYIPESPLNGLDLCYYSDAVLTGAGTLAREAACLGIPSFSFYAGKQILAVDKKLISQNKIFFSRAPDDIVNEIKKTKKSLLNLSSSKEVREELKYKLLEIINRWNY